MGLVIGAVLQGTESFLRGPEEGARVNKAVGVINKRNS